MAKLKALNSKIGNDYATYHGDCVDVLRQLPDRSIGFSIFSPPFSNLFVYSDSEADIGNAADDAQFLKHYEFFVEELARVMKPGRNVAVHCSDLPYMKWRDGVMGIRDLSGDLIRVHAKADMILHSRITIWKNPVTEMTRTNALGLLYMQLKKDSSKSRAGMPDYLLVFRAPGENEEPISHMPEELPLDTWQQWASPVWMDIRQTNTLDVKLAKEKNDERHIAPLQLDLIERAMILWSNKGDIVLSPFMGIGSEGYIAMKLRRRFIGIELKERYYHLGNQALVDAIGDRGFFR